MFSLLLSLAGPALRLAGMGAIADQLKAALADLEIKLDEIFTRLTAVEKKCDSVFHGWQLMQEARGQLPHAAAAEPRRPGESASDYAHRVLGK